MKTKLTLAGLTAATLLLPAAHAQMTGTSHPEQLDDTIVASPQTDTPHYVKPSPAVRYDDSGAAATSAPASAFPSSTTAQPDAEPASSHYQPDTAVLRRSSSPAFDPDANIVTSAPATRPGELGEGTLLRARLQTPLSTRESRVGNTFLAELVQPVTDHGVVLLPAGSQIKGRVSAVHGGRRIGGPASIRLQPDTITLPDGSVRRLYAQVIDLDNFEESHVNSEGTIVGSEHPKATLAALGLTTASATVAGAVIGGGVGAVVGAGIGAGAGTIWWLKRDLQQQLPVGTGLVFSLNEPLDMNQTAMAQIAR
jgi:hypothetical protein